MKYLTIAALALTTALAAPAAFPEDGTTASLTELDAGVATSIDEPDYDVPSFDDDDSLTLEDSSPSNLTTRAASSRVLGWDISGNQPNINAANAYRKGGMRFVYIKATEGLTYHNPSFSKQWTSTTSAGFIRGAYHFAHGKEDPVKQAQFFVAHGGKWSADGKTLPGALDLEGVNNSVCNGVTPSWVKRFSDEYHRLTKRYPVLYFSPGWWTQCMKGSTEFSKTNPLWLAAWGSNPPTKLPGGWKQLTIWQNKDTNKYGGDSDVYLHGLAQLKEFAKKG